MMKQKLAAFFRGAWILYLARTGMFPAMVLGLLVLGLALAYRERGRGHLTKLKAHIESPSDAAPPTFRPGNQDPLVLTRQPLPGGLMPEFLSVTMLPGRGMNTLQITANVPGKGEVSLLDSPSVEEATRRMNGIGEDWQGRASLAMGGALEVPWANRISGVASQTPGRIAAVWRGHTITPPQLGGDKRGTLFAADGMLLAHGTDTAASSTLPDGGGQARAVLHCGDFDANWPSKTDLLLTVLLNVRYIEITVLARNVGDTPEPIGIGWAPRFAIQKAGRGQVLLRIPSQARIELRDRESGGSPTGRFLPVQGTPYDFSARGGTPLGKVSLDDTFAQLRSELMDSGPTAELRDSANHYGLRLTALSTAIKAMRVTAPVDAGFVTIAPESNLDDPFGREWPKDVDTGMVVLQPGEATQWKVRLEIFPLPSLHASK